MLTFLYPHADSSGNYTSPPGSIKEYWFNSNATCDFVVDSNTMLDWYSSDIFALYQVWYND